MKVKLKTLSPLHIGGKEGVIYPFEYIIFNKRCFVINEDRLSQRLNKLGILDFFLEDVKRLGNKFETGAFLRARNLLKDDFLKVISNYSSRCEVKIQRELRPFIRNAYSQPFIPGSSVKGVFRTSIMYTILKRINESVRKRILDDFVQQRLAEYKRDPRGQRGYSWFQERFKQGFAQSLGADLFQKFTLRSDQKRYDAHTDILRYLKVSDSNPIAKDSLTVEEIKIYSARSDESPKNWSIFAECVLADTDFEFDLKIDQMILNDFIKSNRQTNFGMSFADLFVILSNPLIAVQEMTHDLFDEERTFFAQEVKLERIMDFSKERPNFRLGWGEGLLGTSVAMLLPERIRQDLRNTLFRDCGDTPAPKSRRVIVSLKEKSSTLGWCLVST